MRKGNDPYLIENLGEAVMTGIAWLGFIGFLVFVVLGVVGNLFL